MIWKQLVFSPNTAVYFPEGSKILSAHVQKGTIAVWAFVEDPDAPKRPFPIYLYGTGQEISTRGVYVNSVHLDALVLHVFCAPGDRHD